MKFEGLFKVTKRNAASIAGKIEIKGLISTSSMEFAIKDPHSIEALGKIVIEIPDVKKPEPKKFDAPKSKK